jgi:hypothetical protein
MVELNEILTVYYIIAATGVLVAAVYYIMNLRNAEKERRRQNILMRMPPMDKTWYDCYSYLYFTLRGDYTDKEWNEKIQGPEYFAKWSYVVRYYNLVGVLYTEGLMSIEDIVKVYAPGSIIDMFERHWSVIANSRLNSYGKDSNPNYCVPFERLYRELKHRYPGIESFPESTKEREERTKRKRETVGIGSKLTKEQFLASVMK